MKNNFLFCRVFAYVFLIVIFSNCKNDKIAILPILGNKYVETGDTVYHTISPFSLINQDSIKVDNAALSTNIYVADFFFTHCPTICPVVTRQMLRIHDRFIDSSDVQLVSFTLDPKRDTIGRLSDYASKLEVQSDRWSFLTGAKGEIWDLADDFFSIALDDDDAPGGINHSGKLLLVDKQGRIRSYCEGTKEEEVDKFMNDITTLLAEYR